jgi:hypothetical protein
VSFLLIHSNLGSEIIPKRAINKSAKNEIKFKLSDNRFVLKESKRSGITNKMIIPWTK